MSKIDNSRLERAAEVAPEVTQVRGKRLRVGLGGIDNLTDFSWKDRENEKRFFTFWESDVSENGHKIMRRLNQGFEFVDPKEINVAQTNVYTSNTGSYVRVSAGRTSGGWLYLLKQPMEYRLEDLADEQAAAEMPLKTMRDKAKDSPNGVFEMGTQDVRKTI
jgi:hypothetical protein